MGNNKHTAQLKGSFNSSQNLFELIQAEAAGPIKKIKHLGIQAKPGTLFNIDGKRVYVGLTGMYEIYDIEISTLYVKNTDNIIIDYTVEI